MAWREETFGWRGRKLLLNARASRGRNINARRPVGPGRRYLKLVKWPPRRTGPTRGGGGGMKPQSDDGRSQAAEPENFAHRRKLVEALAARSRNRHRSGIYRGPGMIPRSDRIGVLASVVLGYGAIRTSTPGGPLSRQDRVEDNRCPVVQRSPVLRGRALRSSATGSSPPDFAPASNQHLRPARLQGSWQQGGRESTGSVSGGRPKTT